MDASVEEAVCHIRKVSEKSLDLASPVLLEERRDIVGLQSPLRCDNPNLSFISPPSSSGTSHSTSSSCKKRKPGRPRTYSDGYRTVQNSFTRQIKLRFEFYNFGRF